MSFDHLDLSPQLLPAFTAALTRAGHHTPTPIQQQAIQPMLQGRDLIAMAQTGSGKTLAYALPLLQQRCLAPETAPRVLGALVLVPTRELAAQVEDTLHQLAAHLPRRLKIVTATGAVRSIRSCLPCAVVPTSWWPRPAGCWTWSITTRCA